MTAAEISTGLRKIADAIDQIQVGNKSPVPCFEGDRLVAVASFWGYLRDLFTMTPKESFTRDEILVLLDAISTDTELFQSGMVKMIAESEDFDIGSANPSGAPFFRD